MYIYICIYIYIAGPSEWNNLPIVVRRAPSISSFKSRLKTHLFKIHYG